MDIIKANLGDKVNLTKDNPQLDSIIVGCGWDEAKNQDLDVSAVLLDANNKPVAVLYFNDVTANGLGKPGNKFKDVFGTKTLDERLALVKQRLQAGEWAIHSGDNRTGNGAGDDEIVFLSLKKVPSNINAIEFVVNIYQPEANQHFGTVRNVYCHVADVENKKELVRYDLQEDFTGETGSKICRLYRYNGEWKFEALGKPFKGDLNDLVNSY